MGGISTSNTYRWDHCPLCIANDIQKIGSLNYCKTTAFSSTEIEIDHIPELWACQRCGSAFAQNILDSETARYLYSIGQANERWASKPFHIEKTAAIVDYMTEIFRPGGRILDIGCNSGELLDFSASFGCKTSGVEFSTASKEVLSQKGHLVYEVLGDVPEQYDVITAFDVIEHLYDVPEFLSTCAKKLTEHGKLILLTGNIDCLTSRLLGRNWWYVQFPEHIVFPSREFYSNYSGLRIQKITPCYASNYFETTVYAKFKGILHGVFGATNYEGLPPPLPDHNLIVLSRIQQ